MSKEERYIYNCDDYDYAEIVYDTKEYEECDSMKMATNWLNRQEYKIADLEAKLTEEKEYTQQYRKECAKIQTDYYQLKQQLADAEEHIDALELQLREQYQLVDEKDEQLAEKEKEIERLKEKYEQLELQSDYYIGDLRDEIKEADQDKISFAVDVLEEIADCSNYINSKLDFECGSYVSEKAIRDKIKYLKGKKDE